MLHALDAGARDFFTRIRHFHLEDVRGFEQAPNVIVEPENRRTLRRLIGTYAFERTNPVMQCVRQYVNLGIAPRHHFAVHPNHAVSVGVAHFIVPQGG